MLCLIRKKMSEIKPDRTYELAAMVRALGDSDEPLNQIIRFHSLTEVYLESLIKNNEDAKKLYNKSKWITYSRKLELIEKFGLLQSPLIVTLRKLSKLRNQFAHDSFALVTSIILEELVESFPELLKKVQLNLPDENTSVRQVAMVIFIKLTEHLWSKNEHTQIFQKFYT